MSVLFRVACFNGELEKVKALASTMDINIGLGEACRNKKINVVNYLISIGANDWDNGLKQASAGGHLDIVKLMISKGANDWNAALTRATINGHIEIVKLLLKYNPSNIIDIIDYACRHEYLDIVKYLVEYGWTTPESSLYFGVFYHSVDIIEYSLTKKPVNLMDGLRVSFYHDQRKTVIMILSKCTYIPEYINNLNDDELEYLYKLGVNSSQLYKDIYARFLTKDNMARLILPEYLIPDIMNTVLSY